MILGNIEIEEFSQVEELSGNLKKQTEEDKLMSSVLQNDKEKIKQGKIIKEALNQGIGSFVPDMLFKQLCNNYSLTKNLFGEKLIQLICGYNPNYIKKNINIPEFQKILNERIEETIGDLKKDSLIEKTGTISEQGIKLASLVLYTEELEKLIPSGFFGEKIHKKDFMYGLQDDIKKYKKHDRYRDIEIMKSIKLAVRRSHNKLLKDDLKSLKRQSRGQINIIYAIDASGSMKGDKIETTKKAGIALAYKAIEDNDKVGLLVFSSDIKEQIKPTNDFKRLLIEITKIRAGKETNIALTIRKAVELFPQDNSTRHLLILTDVIPTVGKKPEEESLEAASYARNNGITISVIGIRLENKAVKLAEKIANIGNGRFYIVKDIKDMDNIILEEYDRIIK